MKLKFVIVSFLFLTISISPANSIVNGSPAVGADYVVTMIIENNLQSSFCTGAYLRPRVVVTAAHCVIKDGARAPELRFPLENWSVSQPGVDVLTPAARSSRVKVLKIWTDPDFFNRWEPDKGLMETQVNDVAFLFLDKELTGPTITRAASRDEIESFRLGQGRAFHLGYGCIGGANGQVTSNSGKPYLAEDIYGTNYQPAHIPIRDRILSVKYPNGKSVCPGDSGSPLMMKTGSEVIYLGTIFAGGSWENAAKGIQNPGDATVTVLWPFIKNLDEEWSKFLVEDTKNRELKAKQEADAKAAADKAAAELKAKQEAEVAAAIKAKEEAEAKAAAELKATQEAEVKALAEKLAAEKIAAAKLASAKKSTITCVKGKLTKKVTAVKPKCPAGYKVKK